MFTSLVICPLPQFRVWVIAPKIFGICSQNLQNKYPGSHIEFTLSMCACVCLFVCVPESLAAHNFVMHGGI